MKRLLALSTALALISAPAWAQAPADDPAVSPDATPSLDADESAIDTDADGELEVVKNGYTDAHDWVDVPAFADGEQIGDVERVRLDANSEVEALVIETEGFAEIGGREVEISLDQADLVTDENGENTFALNITKSEFEAMPDFDETLASDYPLSDNPFEEDTMSGEGDLTEDEDLLDDAADDLDADDDTF